MSSWYEPDSPPPPPTQSATFKQIIAMLAFGSLGSVFVIQAIGARPGQSLYTGGILIIFAFIFFAGLIVKNRVVEIIASALLVFGAGVLVMMTVNNGEWLWAVGAVFFLLCVVVINVKHMFIDQTHADDSTPRNPYS